MIGIITKIKRALKKDTVFHRQMKFVDILIDKEVCWDAVRHLSDAKQLILAWHVYEYICGYTVQVHNWSEFLKAMVRAFESLKDPYNHEEFERFIHEKYSSSLDGSIDYDAGLNHE